jgi:DNA-binding transcriptional LysR family regulator
VNLVEEGIDVAIRIGALNDSSLVARRLATTRSLVCASPEYLARSGEPEAPEDLATHECLVYSYLSTANVWRFTAPDGREIPVAVGGSLRVNNGILLAQAAVAGQGILATPSFYVSEDLRAGRLREILAGFRMPAIGIHAVYPQKAHVPPKVRAFVDFLARRFGRKPSWEKT